jgi:hypothetical protein
MLLRFIVLGLVPGTNTEITYGWITTLLIIIMIALLATDGAMFGPAVCAPLLNQAKRLMWPLELYFPRKG